MNWGDASVFLRTAPGRTFSAQKLEKNVASLELLSTEQKEEGDSEMISKVVYTQ